jgi:predicted dehydrogenase
MRVRIGIAGDGSEAEFIPLYGHHPDSQLTAHCRLAGPAPGPGEPGLPKTHSAFDDLLADPDVDAVHISASPEAHAGLALRALRAGKHVACSPPMAQSLEECRALVGAARVARRVYMLMEPSVYTREFLFVKRLLDQGELGSLRLLRGAQHTAPRPGDRRDRPPMLDATAAVAPLLGLSGLRARSVLCLGAGAAGGPFAAQTALVRFRDSSVAAEFTRAWRGEGGCGREGSTGFSVYGDRGAFEWRQTARARPILFRAGWAEAADVPDFAHLLPQPLRAYARAARGREGALPHLVHEFLRSVAEGRRSALDEDIAAHWTGIGLCAHASALKDGARIDVPDFDAD